MAQGLVAEDPDGAGVAGREADVDRSLVSGVGGVTELIGKGRGSIKEVRRCEAGRGGADGSLSVGSDLDVSQ
jgi:hypothetical protein